MSARIVLRTLTMLVYGAMMMWVGAQQAPIPGVPPSPIPEPPPAIPPTPPPTPIYPPNPDINTGTIRTETEIRLMMEKGTDGMRNDLRLMEQRRTELETYRGFRDPEAMRLRELERGQSYLLDSVLLRMRLQVDAQESRRVNEAADSITYRFLEMQRRMLLDQAAKGQGQAKKN